MSEGEFSSPACLMHEAERLAPPTSTGWDDVKAWRKQQREVLLKARVQDSNERKRRSVPILERLAAEVRTFERTGAQPHAHARGAGARGTETRGAGARSAALSNGAEPVVEGRGKLIAEQAHGPRLSVPSEHLPVLGIYWPFRSEIDVRDLAYEHIEAGGVVAIPVVVEKHAPVEFWRWRPDAPMTRGLFNIPIPSQRKAVAPDVLIVPLLGFDRAGYRLGYGGGYYDRTLAAANPRPRTVGIAFAEAELETIYPQPHDIPMSRIVTDRFAFEVS